MGRVVFQFILFQRLIRVTVRGVLELHIHAVLFQIWLVDDFLDFFLSQIAVGECFAKLFVIEHDIVLFLVVQDDTIGQTHQNVLKFLIHDLDPLKLNEVAFHVVLYVPRREGQQNAEERRHYAEVHHVLVVKESARGDTEAYRNEQRHEGKYPIAAAYESC